MCGASIISKYWLVSAAHCKEYNANMYTIVVGLHQLRGSSAGKPVRHNLAQFIRHPGFRERLVWGKGQFPDDIALIQTKTPIEYNKYVAKISLDTEGFPEGTRCTITGWGYVKRPPSSPTANARERGVTT